MEFEELKAELMETWRAPPPTMHQLHGLAVQHAADMEQAWMRLIYVMPPIMKDDVVAEVKRRRQFMGEPAAIDSVREDLVTGRWQP